MDDDTKPSLGRRQAVAALLALGSMAGPTGAAAGGHGGAGRTGLRQDPSGAAAGLYAEIDAVLKQTEAIWNSQQFHRLKEVWDADDPEPWYVPEEIKEPFFSWPEIERYWNPGRKVLDAFRWQFSNLRVKSLGDDLALALFDHFYEIDLAMGPPTPPTAGFDRCLALFRRKPEGWRHILYAQCPLGPDTYVRTLREKIVRPDFGAFRDALDES